MRSKHPYVRSETIMKHYLTERIEALEAAMKAPAELGDKAPLVGRVYSCPSCKGEGRIPCSECGCLYNPVPMHRMHHDPCSRFGSSGLVSKAVHDRLTKEKA